MVQLSMQMPTAGWFTRSTSSKTWSSPQTAVSEWTSDLDAVGALLLITFDVLPNAKATCEFAESETVGPRHQVLFLRRELQQAKTVPVYLDRVPNPQVLRAVFGHVHPFRT